MTDLRGVGGGGQYEIDTSWIKKYTCHSNDCNDSSHHFTVPFSVGSIDS